MKIHSKFRTLFLIRVNILFFIIDCFCIYYLLNGLGNEDYKIILESILFLALSLFIHILKLRTVNEIIVLEDGLQKTTLLSGKVEFIPFSSIVNIQTERISGSDSDGGQITTGYFESTILLENGTELCIDPDYDNYLEIVVAVRHNI